jgi:putative ABC transport system permease protein
MLGAFNSIIIVLVVFSALLTFVVMYSLAYIILSERQREIATLKVLGYNQTEIDNYILKEQLNIVIIGIIIGIIVGSLYSSVLINNIKFSELYLVKQIEPLSYFKTAGFIITFTIIVGIGVHFMLKKVKMIESLKSIE